MNLETSLAIVMSAIAVISTIAGPIITSAITCYHDSKQYRKRFLDEHKHEAIERYLRTIGRFAFGEHYDDQRDLGEAMSEIFMYSPEELWPDIQKINKDIVTLLEIKLYNDRKPLVTNLQNSYLELCKKFAPYRRSDEEHKRNRTGKNNK